MNWLTGKNLGNFYPSFFCLLPNYNIQNRLKLHIQMKKNTVYTLSFFCLLFLGQLPAHAQNLLWAKQQGGIDNDYCYSVALDNLGNIFTTGSFSETADFDPGAGIYNLTAVGADDIYITKLDAAGNFVWAKQMGGTGNDLGAALVVDNARNVYVTGWFQEMSDFDPGVGVYDLTSSGTYDTFITKLDPNGNLIWAKKMGGTGSDYVATINIDEFGNVYTAGSFYETCDFDPGVLAYNLTSTGASDIFISKLDSAGNFVWAKKIGGTGYENCSSIVLDNTGNFYLTGQFEGITAIDFDPGPGINNLTASSNFADVFILKLATNGNFIWSKKMGGTGYDAGTFLKLDSLGNLFVTGWFSDTCNFNPNGTPYNLSSSGFYDIFISKLDTTGNLVWAKKIGGPGYDFGFSIAIDATGNVCLTGVFEGAEACDFDPGIGVFSLTPFGFYDAYVVKLNTVGNLIWAKQFGGTGNDQSNSIVSNSLGELLFSGYFNSSVDFDPDSTVFNMTSAGQSDSFICKLGGVLDTEEVPIPQLGINLFPNPCLDFFTLEMAGFQNSVAELYSLQGQLLQRILLVSVRTPIDVALLAKGPYILQIKNDSAVFTQKLLKQ